MMQTNTIIAFMAHVLVINFCTCKPLLLIVKKFWHFTNTSEYHALKIPTKHINSHWLYIRFQNIIQITAPLYLEHLLLDPLLSSSLVSFHSAVISLISRFMGPTWGASGPDRTQVGPMLAPWTLLSGLLFVDLLHILKGLFHWHCCNDTMVLLPVQ